MRKKMILNGTPIEVPAIVDNPVHGIYTQAEFDALTDEEKASGTYFVDDGQDGGSGGEIYDSSEQVIGTWFGKPLYQKTYQYTFPGTTGVYRLIDITDLNIELLVDLFGAVMQSSGVSCWPLNSADANNNGIECWIGSDNLIAFCNTNDYAVNQSGYITLKYTKTTGPEVST